MVIYCNQCGLNSAFGARFCSRCGAPVPPLAYNPPRPLIRPLMGRRIAGVCLALALCYEWDVAVVRILACIGFFCSGGLVLIAYLAGWIGIPSEEYSARL